MVTPRQIAEKTMTPEKRKSAKNDIFAFYIGRPISYILTVPFLEAGIKPNTVSFLSFFPSILGYLLLGFSGIKWIQIIGVLMFILWNFMDGVDGNIARYTDQTSTLGTLWDATSGYIAMMLMYFAVGCSVVGSPSAIRELERIPDFYYMAMGGLASILSLFSRLVMHKKMLLFSYEAGAKLQDKSQYSGIRILALNLTSPSGFIQIIMLLAVVFDLTRLFAAAYFVIQLAATCYSLFHLLRPMDTQEG